MAQVALGGPLCSSDAKVASQMVTLGRLNFGLRFVEFAFIAALAKVLFMCVAGVAIAVIWQKSARG